MCFNISQRSSDILRQQANLWLSIIEVVAGFFWNLTGLGEDIAAHAQVGVTPIEPMPYAFSIWGFIYPAAIAYAIFQAMPSQRENPLLRRIGWWTAVAFLGSTVWALVAQLWWDEMVLAQIIVVIFFALGVAFWRVFSTGRELTVPERRWVAMPVSAYFSWIILATFVNWNLALDHAGLMPFGLTEAAWAVILMMVIGAMAVVALVKSRGNLGYGLILIWGLVGIVVANVVREPHPVVAWTAGAWALAVAGMLGYYAGWCRLASRRE